jgi:hypothetical protein
LSNEREGEREREREVVVQAVVPFPSSSQGSFKVSQAVVLIPPTVQISSSVAGWRRKIEEKQERLSF